MEYSATFVTICNFPIVLKTILDKGLLYIGLDFHQFGLVVEGDV